jgi:hypothetical protein
MDRDKKERRALKRAVKRAGQKHLRAVLKRDLRDRPEEAAFTETDFGRHRSDHLNGQDHDSTRRQNSE